MRLGDVCTKIGSGATPKGGKEAYKPSGIPLIRSQNVLDWSFTSNGLAFVDEGQAAALANVEVEPRDILLNITGDSVARACMVPDWCTPARVNQHVSIVRPGPDLDPTFLLCFLQSSKPLLLKLASSGATRNALTKGMIGDLEIELPNIETQRAIASLIGQIQQKIVLNQQTNDYLLELCAARYDEARRESADDSRSRFEPGVLTDLIEVNYGKDHKKLADGPYPVYGSGGLMRHVEKYLHNGESVLIPRKGTLNNVMLVDGRFWTVDTMFFTKELSIGAARYAYFILKRLDLTSMNAGSAVPSMTTKILSAIPVSIPDDDLLQELKEWSDPLFAQIRLNEQENEQLESMRDALLPKLMSGEIDVSEVELPTQPNNHLCVG